MNKNGGHTMIKELYEKVKLKEHTQNKLKELYTRRDELINKVDVLKKSMIKEQKDVDSLEKGTLTAFFFEIRGTKEQKLDKERAEAYEAKMKYDNAVYQLSETNAHIEHYEQQINALQGCEQNYENALRKRQAELRNHNPKILQLEENIASSKLLQKEVTEAIQAGEKANEIAMQVLSKLKDADSWAIYDMVGGGFIADMAKYSALDEAEQLVQQLQAQLDSFKTELTDVTIQVDIQISIDSMLKTADYFFDNIFTDFTVRSRIEVSTAQVQDTLQQINKLLSYLDSFLENERKREKDATTEIEQLILNASTDCN